MQPAIFSNRSQSLAPSWRANWSRPQTERLRELAPFVLLILAFVFFGLTGHDPWKADEAYVFGVIHTMDVSGDWLIPIVGGEPFMEKPPLYYWTAGGFMRLLSGWMGEPDAARMASGFFMLVTCWSVAAATRVWWGARAGRYAPLLVLACLGTLTQTHMMMPDVPLLTGFALSAWGYSKILQRPTAGGILLGIGVGVSFLSKGILGPAVIGLTGVALPACFAQWRQGGYLRGLMVALTTALPFLIIWPTLLYVRAPTLFHVWIWDNNFGRFFGFSAVHHGTEHPPGFWWQTLPWFTFPALPLAAFALWRQRHVALCAGGICCAAGGLDYFGIGARDLCPAFAGATGHHGRVLGVFDQSPLRPILGSQQHGAVRAISGIDLDCLGRHDGHRRAADLALVAACPARRF